MKLTEWQPILGCSYASPGCINCKTMELAPSNLKADFLALGLLDDKHHWTGSLAFNAVTAQEPLLKAEGSFYQVNPHGDLFHENTPDDWLDEIFDIMDKASWHSFQILTKRAERQCEYVNGRYSSAPKNIVCGASCERQQEVDERLPWLAKTNAIRYLTLYPVLGPIDISPFLQFINAVAAGEEPERPANPLWLAAIAEQCRAKGVPYVQSNRLVGME